MHDNNIILNIGIQLEDVTRALTHCDVALTRLPSSDAPDTPGVADTPDVELLNSSMPDNADYNIETEEDSSEYDEQQLEATGIELTREEWYSGAQSIECLSVSLQIDAAWCGPVILRISTEKLIFEAEAHLHPGLNSFFVKSGRLTKKPKPKTLLKRMLTPLLWAVGATILIIAGWSLIDAVWLDSNQPKEEIVADTVAADTVAADTMQLQPVANTTTETPSSDGNAGYYQAPTGGSFADYNDFQNDSNALEDPQIAPPRKENTYGIEP